MEAIDDQGFKAGNKKNISWNDLRIRKLETTFLYTHAAESNQVLNEYFNRFLGTQQVSSRY